MPADTLQPSALTTEELQAEYERLTIRETALQDFDYFCDHIMRDRGNANHVELAPVHHQFAKHLQKLGQECGFRAINLFPRAHLKTWEGSICYPLWRYVRNNNIRVAIFHYIEEIAETILGQIRFECQTNTRLHYAFPETYLAERDRGTKSKFSLKRTARLKEPTFSAVGVSSATAGLHWDLFVYDDVIPEPTPQRPHTAEFLEAITKWWWQTYFLIDSPKRTDVMVTGTRWHEADIYGELLEDPDWKRFIRVVEKNGRPLWPEKWPMEAIRKEKQKFARAGQIDVFHAQFYNDPVPASEARLGGYQTYSRLPDALEIEGCVIATDPASSISPRADFTAHVVILYTRQREVYVDYALQERIDPSKIVNRVFEIRHGYRHLHPRWAPEEVGFQRILQGYAYQEMLNRGQGFAIAPVKRPATLIKDDFILGAIEPYVGTGRLFVNVRATDLMHQLRRFPKLQHDDLVDALAMALKSVPPGRMPQSFIDARPVLPPYQSNEQRVMAKQLEPVAKSRRVRQADDVLGVNW